MKNINAQGKENNRTVEKAYAGGGSFYHLIFDEKDGFTIFRFDFLLDMEVSKVLGMHEHSFEDVIGFLLGNLPYMEVDPHVLRRKVAHRIATRP